MGSRQQQALQWAADSSRPCSGQAPGARQPRPSPVYFLEPRSFLVLFFLSLICLRDFSTFLSRPFCTGQRGGAARQGAEQRGGTSGAGARGSPAGLEVMHARLVMHGRYCPVTLAGWLVVGR